MLADRSPGRKMVRPVGEVRLTVHGAPREGPPGAGGALDRWLEEHEAEGREVRAGAFGVRDAVEEAGAPLPSEFQGHPGLRRRVEEGYHVVRFRPRGGAVRPSNVSRVAYASARDERERTGWTGI